MQTERGESLSPTDWFLIACDGDLMLRLARDLKVGEDAAGELILNPPDEDALLRISMADGTLVFQVIALDMTLSVAGGGSVQHLAIDSQGTVKVRLPSSTLSLTTSLSGADRNPDFLDVALMRTGQPAITRERISFPEVPAPPAVEDLIGPVPEVEVADKVEVANGVAEDPACLSAPEDLASKSEAVVPTIHKRIWPRRVAWILAGLIVLLAAALVPINLRF